MYTLKKYIICAKSESPPPTGSLTSGAELKTVDLHDHIYRFINYFSTFNFWRRFVDALPNHSKLCCINGQVKPHKCFVIFRVIRLFIFFKNIFSRYQT